MVWDSIRRNAARGFTAVTLPEMPHRIGMEPIFSEWWTPIIEACAETDTVVCLHVGSSSSAPTTSSDAPADTIGVLFFGWAMFAAVDWLYSRIPVRFPALRICLSEGGIGWVAGLLDRLDHVERYQHMYGTWDGIELTPAQELAVALRHLDDVGWCENLTGHITVQQGEQFLVNPWGLWWEEISASDLCTVDADANVVSGKWDVTPAIHIHTELHRRRPDARVVIHNHPYWVTVMAAVGMLPEILHQNGSMFFGDLDFVNEYTGEVDSAELGADLVTALPHVGDDRDDEADDQDDRDDPAEGDGPCQVPERG
mgnify:CR=1 FL=1